MEAFLYVMRLLRVPKAIQPETLFLMFLLRIRLKYNDNFFSQNTILFPAYALIEETIQRRGPLCKANSMENGISLYRCLLVMDSLTIKFFLIS